MFLVIEGKTDLGSSFLKDNRKLAFLMESEISLIFCEGKAMPVFGV